MDKITSIFFLISGIALLGIAVWVMSWEWTEDGPFVIKIVPEVMVGGFAGFFAIYLGIQGLRDKIL